MGRSRKFNIDEAIAIATKLFWEKGYEGTSLAELTSAMGINPPSFYAAFESKAALFRIVLDRYRGQYLGFAAKALEEPTARPWPNNCFWDMRTCLHRRGTLRAA
jgi:AcrR family transcriptional regulator